MVQNLWFFEETTKTAIFHIFCGFHIIVKIVVFSRGFLKPRNSIKIGFFHSLGASRRPGRVRLNLDF